MQRAFSHLSWVEWESELPGSLDSRTQLLQRPGGWAGRPASSGLQMQAYRDYPPLTCIPNQGFLLSSCWLATHMVKTVSWVLEEETRGLSLLGCWQEPEGQ